MRTLTLSLSVCLLTSCRPAAQPTSAPQPEPPPAELPAAQQPATPPPAAESPKPQAPAVSVEVARVRYLIDFEGRPLLAVGVRVTNTSETRVARLQPWRSGEAAAADEHGNTYEVRPAGRAAWGSAGGTNDPTPDLVRPGESAIVPLEVDLPTKAAAELRLTVSGRNVGLSGSLRFTIPRPENGDWRSTSFTAPAPQSGGTTTGDHGR